MDLNTSARKRNTRRRGAVNMEYVFGAALALVIVASIVLAITSGGKSGRGEKIGPKDRQYSCEKCEKVFVLTVEEQEAIRMPGPLSPKVINCKLCGAENSAWEMMKCPGCKKWYVPLTAKAPTSQDPIICPHCQLDYRQYMKDQRAKRNK